MAITVTTKDITEITSDSAISGGVITGDVGAYNPLVDIIMKNKFQIYNSAKQTIESEITSLELLRPFQLLKDSKQSDKKLLLVANEYHPTQDMSIIVAMEFDDTTNINLI